MTVRRRDSSAESAARFLSMYHDPERPDTYEPPAVLGQPRPSTVSTAILRELLVEQSGRIPIRAPELFDRVRGEYGTVSENRLRRALARVVQEGLILKTSEGYRRP